MKIFSFISNTASVIRSKTSLLIILAMSINCAKAQVNSETHTKVVKTVVENLGPNVNSGASEMFPIISADGKTLYFVRDGHADNKSGQDVWYCNRAPDGSWLPAVHPGSPINQGRNTYVSNVSPDGNQLLVKGAYVDGEYEGQGISVVVKNKKGAWKDPQKLEMTGIASYFAMGSYQTTYLTPSGKTMIMSFSSSGNDDKGDIYVSQLTLKDKWNKPKSIKDFTKFVSKALNHNTWSEPVKITALSPSNSDEIGPFMAADGITLYYSSDKEGGLGGLDMWMTKRLDDTWQNWSTPVNMGSPINTEGSDYYYSLDAKGEEAYMTKGKTEGGYGKTELVKIKLTTEMRPNPVIIISGKVFNAKTKEPIGASIEYETLIDGRNVGIANSNPLTGEYKIVLPYGKNYGFMAYADKHASVSDNFDLTTVAEYKEITRDLYLVPIEVGTTIRLNNIFFDVAKATLRPESYPELDRLAGLMTQNGKMQIELSGHTDNVGGAEANLKLSEERAKSVTEYLIKLGVAADRVVVKGYGETKPLTTNDTDEGKQMNRRVEFTILKN